MTDSQIPNLEKINPMILRPRGTATLLLVQENVLHMKIVISPENNFEFKRFPFRYSLFCSFNKQKEGYKWMADKKRKPVTNPIIFQQQDTTQKLFSTP